MTNVEWFYEHFGWRMAEPNDDLPPENGVSGEAMDVTTEKRSKAEHDGLEPSSNLLEPDSREKLEEDIAETIDFWGAAYPDARVRVVIEWLDRQAAITDAEWESEQAYINGGYKERIAEQNEQIAELEDKVGELTDAISELLCKQPYTFDPHDARGSIGLIGRYIDELKSRHCPHYHVREHYCDVHETRIAELTAEREEYRALCGKMLGVAQELRVVIDAWEDMS